MTSKERINLAQEKLERMEKIRRTVEILGAIRDAYRSIQPKLRSEFVKVLRNFVQQVLDSLVGGEAPMLNVVIDETYTPYVKSESGVDREVIKPFRWRTHAFGFCLPFRFGTAYYAVTNRSWLKHSGAR